MPPPPLTTCSTTSAYPRASSFRFGPLRPCVFAAASAWHEPHAATNSVLPRVSEPGPAAPYAGAAAIAAPRMAARSFTPRTLPREREGQVRALCRRRTCEAGVPAGQQHQVRVGLDLVAQEPGADVAHPLVHPPECEAVEPREEGDDLV